MTCPYDIFQLHFFNGLGEVVFCVKRGGFVDSFKHSVGLNNLASIYIKTINLSPHALLILCESPAAPWVIHDLRAAAWITQARCAYPGPAGELVPLSD